MTTLDPSLRSAIVADLQRLEGDLDIPVYIEGDIFNGVNFVDMEAGEAARIVVDVVLGHPHVASALTENEKLWSALKWLVAQTDIRLNPPDELRPAINAAIDSLSLEGDLKGPI